MPFDGVMMAQANTDVNEARPGYTAIGQNGVVISAGNATDATNVQLSLNTTPTKGLLLMQGLPMAGSSLQLCSTGVTLASLAPGTGPTIAMTAAGIKVSVGPTTVLQLSETAISIKFGGSTLTVDSTGVSFGTGASKVTVKSNASVQLNSTEVKFTGNPIQIG